MKPSSFQTLLIAVLGSPVLLLADAPAAKTDKKTDSQTVQATNGESVSQEVRSLNGAKVTIERKKDAGGNETITMRTPKGNGRDRVKVITEKEYQRLFGSPAKAQK